MGINVSNEYGWQQLVSNNLKTVVDPLVLRSGEFFLQGKKGASSANSEWDFLKKNLHSVGMFFDALILQEKIPVFNYADTFDSNLTFSKNTLYKINDFDEVLIDVNVDYPEYMKVKNAAISELLKIYNGGEKAEIRRAASWSIIKELVDAGNQWSPKSWELEQTLQTEDEKQMASYLLGGLIFGGYAQQMGTEHLLQPKRSRILAALTMGVKEPGRNMEDELFAGLKKYANTAMDEIPWTPTFFPYLLSKVNNHSDMINEVVKLRRSPEIVDYRQWLSELMTDWRKNGKISLEKRRDIQRIQKSVENRITGTGTAPTVEFKVNIAEVAAHKPPLPEINFTPWLEGAWGWVLTILQGNRYRKILTRAIISDFEYINLQQRMFTVWS